MMRTIVKRVIIRTIVNIFIFFLTRYFNKYVNNP